MTLCGMLRKWRKQNGTLMEFLKLVWVPRLWKKTRRRRITGEMHVQAPAVVASATGTAYDATVETRHGAAEWQYERLADQMRALQEAADRDRAAGRDAHQHLEQVVTSQLATQRKESVDGLRQEALGLLLIFTGTIIATVPGLFC